MTATTDEFDLDLRIGDPLATGLALGVKPPRTDTTCVAPDGFKPPETRGQCAAPGR